MKVQKESTWNPADKDFARLLADLAISAEAMGLVRLPDTAISLDLDLLDAVLSELAKAGIARKHIAQFRSTEQLDPKDTVNFLSYLTEVLEESPLPTHEWEGLLRVFDNDDLAKFLNVSPSSLTRYARGQRATPDEVAERLHFLARLVGDLKGTYNDLGIRRWFQRPRSRLKDHSPAELLQGEWLPEDPSPQAIRKLARSLVLSSAT